MRVNGAGLQGAPLRTLVRVLALVAPVLCAGCPEEKKTPSGGEPAPSAAPAVLPEDAFAPVDPPRPAGDLQADLDAFTTIAACTEARAKVDPVVGDALDAIGYDTFLRDACRMLDATKAKDAARCDAIDASSLRGRCRAWVAMAKGDADACPLRADLEPASGRDPTCVAAALRSPALCGGETRGRRPTCTALVSHEAKGCEALLGAERTSCVRGAERWRRVLVGDAQVAAVPAASGTLEVHGDGREDPAEPKVDLAADVETGVALVDEGPAKRFTVGTLLGALSQRAVGPAVRTRIGAELYVVGPRATVERLELGVPGATTLVCPGAACELTAKVQKLEPKRGGAVELRLEGTVGVAPQRFRIDATVKTWVRDMVPALHPLPLAKPLAPPTHPPHP